MCRNPSPATGNTLLGFIELMLISEALEDVAVLRSKERRTNVILNKEYLSTFSASNCWQPLVLQNRKDREFPPSQGFPHFD